MAPSACFKMSRFLNVPGSEKAQHLRKGDTIPTASHNNARRKELGSGDSPLGSVSMNALHAFFSNLRLGLLWYLPYLTSLALAMICLTVSRLVFALANRSLFVAFDVSPFWYGLQFDLATLAYWYLPYHIVSLTPLVLGLRAANGLIARLVFHCCNLGAVFLNLMDAGYYPFSKQRSSFDTLVLLVHDMDVQHLMHKYLVDWWYLVIPFVVAVILVDRAYARAVYKVKDGQEPHPTVAVVLGCLIVGGLALGTRSSRLHQPLRIVNACEHVPASLSPVVLNTPFVVIKSYGESVKPRVYFTETETKQRFDPVLELKPGRGMRKPNVVFIVVESLSSEFVGAYNGGSGYTPFIDSLCARSTICSDSFASARRTIDIGPALLAGLPTLIDHTLVRSSFAANRADTLPSLLKPIGYESWFFHGARPGSMSYDVFARKAGFDHVFTKSDYPGPACDDDGRWGIWDEPFLQFMARKLELAKQPFLAYVHTLSSHHPFKVPKQYEKQFPKGRHPICEPVGYADFALKRFFDSVMTMPWYTNAIFVVTGDHTAQFTHSEAASPLAMYQVPILILDTARPEHRVIAKPVSHVDLFPTILGLVGWSGRVVSFGRDVYSDSPGYVVQYLNNNYQLVTSQWCLAFNGEKTLGFFKRTVDPLCRTNLVRLPEVQEEIQELEGQLKAYLQAYTTRLLRNQFSVEH
ncbi:MAG: sulfatase-like hydrolase/transferase [Verrucomicrobiae bacterium]|nr:sulfatase-like hydrolase/transferase [Verrucomicrobiae bacterium]